MADLGLTALSGWLTTKKSLWFASSDFPSHLGTIKQLPRGARHCLQLGQCTLVRLDRWLQASVPIEVVQLLLFAGTLCSKVLVGESAWLACVERIGDGERRRTRVERELGEQQKSESKNRRLFQQRCSLGLTPQLHRRHHFYSNGATMRPRALTTARLRRSAKIESEADGMPALQTQNSTSDSRFRTLSSHPDASAKKHLRFGSPVAYSGCGQPVAHEHTR